MIDGINQACERLEKFEKKKHHIYDFDEIDLKFYNEYTAYLKKQNYASILPTNMTTLTSRSGIIC